MTFIVDQYGTRTWNFSVYDSDTTIGYHQGDSIIRNGIIYVATTDIPSGTPFELADSELDAQKWLAKVTGAESAALSTLSDVNVTTPVHEDVLQWDSDLQKWIAGPAVGGGTSNINDSDVKVIFDSEFSQKSIDDLLDVDTTTVPAKNLSSLYYDSDALNWVPLTLRHREDSFVIDSDHIGTNSFALTNTPHEVTNFFRNGMRIVKAAWSQSDSDAVYYYAAQNGNSSVVFGDEIQITYNTISE